MPSDASIAGIACISQVRDWVDNLMVRAHVGNGSRYQSSNRSSGCDRSGDKAALIHVQRKTRKESEEAMIKPNSM